MAPSKRLPRTGRVLGDAAVTGSPRPVALRTDDALRHLHVLGPTGVGKSTLLANLALQDMAAGHSVVVIDPKGDLVEDLLARVPQDRCGDVVVLDARDACPVGINPMFSSASPDLAADVTLSVLHSLYADSWGPRTHDILHACLLTLARRGDSSLVMVPLLLTNSGFRRSVTGRLVKADPIGLGSFWNWYEGTSDGERQAAIAPLMNKLRPVLLRPGIRAVLGQRTPKLEMGEVFTKRKILLVSLAKGQLGPEAAQLLGSLVVALLWQSALARTGTPANRRRPVSVIVDEVQDYLRLPGDLGDALAQARGLGVGFTLAHQHLGQLPKSLREAILANARSRVAFQLSTADAKVIAGTTRGVLGPEDFEALPAFEGYASVLVDGASAPWVSLRTRPMPPISADLTAVRRLSAARYGRPLGEIEADLLSLVESPATAAQSATDADLGRSPRADAGGAS
ncbi:MAG: helicase HerA domain-containing protein [Nocardioides sp.]